MKSTPTNRTVKNAYDHCADKALLDLLSLEIENDSEDFVDYELSVEEARKINVRSFSIITDNK